MAAVDDTSAVIGCHDFLGETQVCETLYNGSKFFTSNTIAHKMMLDEH